MRTGRPLNSGLASRSWPLSMNSIVIELVLQQQQMLALLLPIEMVGDCQDGPIVGFVLPEEINYGRLID